jgi:polyisoprenoid-binding protein YceI
MKKGMKKRNNWCVFLGVMIGGSVLLAWCTTPTSSIDEIPSVQQDETKTISTGDAEQQVGESDLSNTNEIKTLIPSQSQLQWAGKRVLYTYTWLVDFKWGTLIFNNGLPVWGEFVIDMTAMSIANWSDWVLKHLSGEDFFAVDQYPEAKLVITSVKPTDNALRFDMTADMTIKGITNPVTFTATFDEDLTSATTQLTINRTLWDITFGSSNFFQGLWDKAISDEIPFEVSLELE